MAEVDITFKREGASGIVAVGSYLIDAAKRCGVKYEHECDIETGTHFCEMDINVGDGLLSAKTAVEEAFFAENKTNANSRLGCQVKIERPGEIEVMTKENPEEKVKEEQEKEYKKEFAELPLEKKYHELVQLEAMALSDTLSFVINSPYKIADKIMDVLAEFGLKMESDKKVASRPAEHTENGKADEDINDAKPESKAEASE